jgi:hypothetical protein
MSAFVQAIQAKFGIDLGAIIGPISPGGNAGLAQGAGGTKITAYGYQGDLTGDPASLAGIGNHNNQLTPYAGGATPSGAALSASAAAQYGVALGQQFTVQGANGQTYNLIYQDTAPELTPIIDIFDPNQLLANGGSDNNFETAATSVTNGATTIPAAGGANLGDFWNAIMHPVETAQVAGLGMFTLVLSYVAAFLQWLVALAQSVLFYAEIALAPVFVGFLLVPGLQHIAKGFVLSFVAICLWRLAFLVTGLITQLLLGLATNSGNVAGAGEANAVGLSYLWLICVALVVIVGSLVGPWWISHRFVAGASGVAELLIGTGAAGLYLAQAGARTVSAASGASAPVSIASSAMMHSRSGAPNFARRPTSSGDKA